MKILIVSPIDIVHLKAGGSSRIWSDIQALRRRNDIKVLLPHPSRNTEKENGVELVSYWNVQMFKPFSSKIRILLDMHTQLLNPSFIKRYRQEARNADVIIANFPMSFLASKFWMPNSGKPIIYVAHVYEYGLITQITRSRLIRTYVKFLESYACKHATNIACTSIDDMVAISNEYDVKNKIVIIPNSIQTINTPTRPTAETRRKIRYDMGFVDDDFIVMYHANFGVIANQDALKFIIEQMIPRIEEKKCQVKMMMVGAAIPQKYKSTDTIRFFSDVPDIWPYLFVADAEVVPLNIGSGTRLKILECFFAGLPVISTQKGIEGIPYHDRVHAIVAPLDAVKIVDKILELKDNQDLQRTISQNARQLFDKEFSTKAIEAKYDSLLRCL